MERRAAARAIVECGQRLWQAGLIAGIDGNISVKLAGGSILITPSGRHKAELAPEDLVELEADGRFTHPFSRPSSELDLHLKAYAAQPGCRAVVHAHPPTATGFAVAGVALEWQALPELVLLTGPVPIVPYATPGTPALGDAALPFLRNHVAVLLAQHGAVTMGRTLDEARVRMESVEHAARILLAARTLGAVTVLTATQLAALPHPPGEIPHD